MALLSNKTIPDPRRHDLHPHALQPPSLPLAAYLLPRPLAPARRGPSPQIHRRIQQRLATVSRHEVRTLSPPPGAPKPHHPFPSSSPTTCMHGNQNINKRLKLLLVPL